MQLYNFSKVYLQIYLSKVDIMYACIIMHNMTIYYDNDDDHYDIGNTNSFQSRLKRWFNLNNISIISPYMLGIHSFKEYVSYHL